MKKKKFYFPIPFQSSHQQVQSTLDELQAQKGKLAYDKGRLQSRVEQLQRELESLANGQMELTQNRKQVAALEGKLQQVAQPSLVELAGWWPLT